MKKLGWLVGFLVFVGVGVLATVLTPGPRLYLAPPSVLGGAVRVRDASGDRLILLTSQWEKRVFRRRSSLRQSSALNVDLWTFDAATAQPLSRQRLKRAQVNGDAAVLGVDHGLLWARIPELIGIRLSDGVVMADPARIAQRNPGIASVFPLPPGEGRFLPESMQPIRFDADTGLVVLLADARRVRIDPLTLEATPWAAAGQEDRGQDSAPPAGPPGDDGLPQRQDGQSLSGSNYWQVMVRGLYLENDWLGLLAESELAEVNGRSGGGGGLGGELGGIDYSQAQRLRLYRAEVRTTDEFFGRVRRVYNPRPLPDSPEFIMAGLLIDGDPDLPNDQKSALWRRDPDSVFVLHRDRIDALGHLQVSRISGPAGQPVWTTNLPLSELHGWLPGSRQVLIIGPDRSAERWAMADEDEASAMQIVSLDLGSGQRSHFNLDLHRDWPVYSSGSSKP